MRPLSSLLIATLLTALVSVDAIHAAEAEETLALNAPIQMRLWVPTSEGYEAITYRMDVHALTLARQEGSQDSLFVLISTSVRSMERSQTEPQIENGQLVVTVPAVDRQAFLNILKLGQMGLVHQIDLEQRGEGAPTLKSVVLNNRSVHGLEALKAALKDQKVRLLFAVKVLNPDSLSKIAGDKLPEDWDDGRDLERVVRADESVSVADFQKALVAERYALLSAPRAEAAVELER